MKENNKSCNESVIATQEVKRSHETLPEDFPFSRVVKIEVEKVVEHTGPKSIRMRSLTVFKRWT